MKRNRKVASFVLSCLTVGAIGGLFILPLALTQVTPSDQSVPEPTSYTPEVQQLLETTYLGYAANLPDFSEPAIVLRKYLEQNAHGYHSQLAEQGLKLDAELAVWQGLALQYPQSRHALVGLAKHYRTKAQASGDIGYTRQAADAYIRAAEIGLTHGHIRYTRELSELLVELGDKTGLDEIFGRMLAQPKDLDRDHYYLALVDYANGLALLSEARAWGYFEEAIDFHPENNLEAINRYAQHLLIRGREQVQKALDILDTRLTSEQRVRFVLPAQLRKQAMEILGLDTASADVELALIEQRLGQGLWGNAPLADRSSKVMGTGASAAALATAGSRVSDILAPAVALAATADSRVSAIFAVPPDNTGTTADERIIKQDAIFSPNGAMNNRWLNMSPTVTTKKVATLKWPNSQRAGLVRIGTDNTVYYRYFNGASWGTWQGLGQTAVDVAAAAWPNGQADIFIVGTDSQLRQSRSTNGVSWGSWILHIPGLTVSEVATAVTPNNLLFLAARATFADNAVWVVTSSDGINWPPTGWTNLGQPPGGPANDLTLLAYNNTVGLGVVGYDNCSLHQRHWTGGAQSNWNAWFTYSSSPCFKKISSFNTSDGGAYLVYIGTTNNALYTQRFTGGAWAGIMQQGTRTWIAAAGANIDDEAGNAYEHTEYSDDCRVQPYTNGPVCDSYGNCFWTQGVNLAEVIYNEARGETPGAQDTVGWTVRDRAFQGLSCDAYPGGNTVCATPCNDPNFCGSPYNTQRYCCAMHGGQTQWGTSGYQFNDEHVDINTLSSSGVIWEAFYVGNGWVGDVSTSWCPPGVAGCSFACSGPGSTSGSNYNSPSSSGPMEFRASSYTPTISSCKQAPTVNTCSGAANNYVCCNASPNNYFWNRRP